MGLWKWLKRRVGPGDQTIYITHRPTFSEATREHPADASAEAAVPPPPPPPPPLVAACAAAAANPDAVVVSVIPSGRYEAASFGGAAAGDPVTPEELADYCRRNPIHSRRNSAEPPPGLSLCDRAAYAAVLAAMPDDQKQELYKTGGMPLVREAVLSAVEKLKAADRRAEASRDASESCPDAG